jgi:hypothetical protein
MISLYHDRELSSPWKEKLEAHLESCPECRAVLASYRQLETAELPEGMLETAQERVWNKLLEQTPELTKTTSGFYRADRRRMTDRIWNRRVSLPLPAVAAAAVLIAVVFVALLGIQQKEQPLPYGMMAAGSMGLDDQGIIPINDMNDVLHYRSSQDSGDIMVIRLPESRNFSRSGEPALINAADYSRVRRSGGQGGFSR